MRFFIMILLLLLLPLSANASVLDDVRISIEETTLITISGNEECANIGDAVTVFVIPGEEERIPENDGEIEHVDIISVGRNAQFTHTFGFNGDAGKYVIGVKDQFGNSRCIVKNLYTKDELEQFAYDVRDKKLSESELISAINMYADTLGITPERLADSRNVAILKNSLMSSKVSQISNGFEDLAGIVDDVKKEWDMIDRIENSVHWYDIAEIIDENRSYIGVDSKWNSYHSKQDICDDLLNYKIVDLDSLAEKINKAMNKGNSDSGGSRGGGGSLITKAPDNIVIPPTSTSTTFVDIEGVSWAKEAILSLANDGVLSGVGDNCFAPERTVKREELAKMLVLAFDIPIVKGGSGFKDVPTGSWYADYVYTLRESGISNGISEHEFGVGMNVSRQDIATLLYRFMKSKGFNHSAAVDEFKDSDDIAEYAFVPVHAMAACGVINGVGNNMFDPLSDTTRAQAAKLIYEVAKLY